MKQNYYITYSFIGAQGGIVRGNEFVTVMTDSAADLLSKQVILYVTKYLSRTYAGGKDDSVMIDFIFRVADGELGGSESAS